MSDSITYILGAGASFQSISVVNTFARRFREFIDAVSLYSTNSNVAYSYEPLLFNLRDISKTLLKEKQKKHQ